MIVKVKRLTPTAKMPFRAHPTDAGADLYADTKTVDDYGNIVYTTGLAFEIPEGYVGLLFPRSSNAKMDLRLTNCVGVLDCCFRGNVSFKYRMTYETPIDGQMFHGKDHEYEVGDRCGQIVIIKLEEILFEESDVLSETDRGDGGYGSTGK